MIDDRRRRRLAGPDDGRERHHVAVRRARVVLAQIGRLRAELLVALHVPRDTRGC